MSFNSAASSKKSQRISRYSNVNISMLNNLKSLETNAENDLDTSFTKQTKIEQKITLLTIKRTMLCFFLIIYSIPFFISTTYKSYLTEYEPIADLANDFIKNNDQSGYVKLMNLVVSQHIGDFDPLIYLSGPGFLYQSDSYKNKEIRQLSLRDAAWNKIEFQIDLSNTVKLYAICGVCGYILAGALLISFVMYISKDLNTYVIFPLESMYEKVSILSRDPMAATTDDFINRAGIDGCIR